MRGNFYKLIEEKQYTEMSSFAERFDLNYLPVHIKKLWFEAFTLAEIRFKQALQIGQENDYKIGMGLKSEILSKSKANEVSLIRKVIDDTRKQVDILKSTKGKNAKGVRLGEAKIALVEDLIPMSQRSNSIKQQLSNILNGSKKEVIQKLFTAGL